jgi:hypothetical protein
MTENPFLTLGSVGTWKSPTYIFCLVGGFGGEVRGGEVIF